MLSANISLPLLQIEVKKKINKFSNLYFEKRSAIVGIYGEASAP